MADHHDHIESDGPFAAGWLWALVAAIVTAVLARWFATPITGAVLLALGVFVVFAVLLAQFWEAPVGEDHGDSHGHGHDAHGHAAHGDDVHGHEAHGHASAAPVTASAPTPVVAAPAPTVAAAATVAAPAPEAKPVALTGPRDGKADNLQEIEGIGPALEKLAHELGIFHFDQIAAWGPGEIAWMDSNLKGFKGRVTRDKWVSQAKIIQAEGVEAFRIRAKTNDY